MACVLGNAGSDNKLKRSNTNDEVILKLYLQFDVEKPCFSEGRRVVIKSTSFRQKKTKQNKTGFQSQLYS